MKNYLYYVEKRGNILNIVLPRLYSIYRNKIIELYSIYKFFSEIIKIYHKNLFTVYRIR